MIAGFEVYNANGELINSDSYLRLNYVKSIGDGNIQYTKQNDEAVFYEGVVGGTSRDYKRHIFSTSSGPLGNTGVVSFDENGALLNKITETTPIKMYCFEGVFVGGPYGFVFNNGKPDQLPSSRYAFLLSSYVRPYIWIGGNMHINAAVPLFESVSTGVKTRTNSATIGIDYDGRYVDDYLGIPRNIFLCIIDISEIPNI